MLRSRAEAIRANSARETVEKIEAIKEQLVRMEATLDLIFERLSEPDRPRTSNAKAKGD